MMGSANLDGEIQPGMAMKAKSLATAMGTIGIAFGFWLGARHAVADAAEFALELTLFIATCRVVYSRAPKGAQ